MPLQALPFARGKVHSTTPDSTDLELMLGHIFESQDVSGSTGRRQILQVVRNESGSTLSAGRGVKYKSTEYGISVDGYADPSHEMFAGYVDDQLTTTVPANGVFLIVLPEDLYAPAKADGDTVHTGFPSPDKQLDSMRWHGVKDDFNSFLEDAVWNTTADSGSAQAIQDEVNGVLLMTADTSDEDEVAISTPGAQFLFAQYKPIVFGARVKLTEASTNQANIYVGLASGNVNAVMGDSGGGPPSSYSGALFAKLSGTSVWSVETSIGSTQSTTASAAAFTSGSWHTVYCRVFATSATSATAIFYIDGVLVATKTFTYTGAAQMRFLVGVHNGSANAEALRVDKAFCLQLK